MTYFLLTLVVLFVPAALAILLARRNQSSPFRWPRQNAEQVVDNPNEFGEPYYVVDDPEVIRQSGQPICDLTKEARNKDDGGQS